MEGGAWSVAHPKKHHGPPELEVMVNVGVLIAEHLNGQLVHGVIIGTPQAQREPCLATPNLLLNASILSLTAVGFFLYVIL